jgi:hypothetical protein
MHQGPLLFRISTLMQFFANDFATRLAQVAGDESKQELYRAAGRG